MNRLTFKLILVGEQCVGNSAFVDRHTTKNFIERYLTDTTVNSELISFYTDTLKVEFNVWDCPSLSVLHESYYCGADCAMVMFNPCEPSSMAKVPHYISRIHTLLPDAPIVLVGTHHDRKMTNAMSTSIQSLYRAMRLRFGAHRVIDCFIISSKTGHNVDEPFLALTQNMLDDQSLQFVSLPPIWYSLFNSTAATSQSMIDD